MDDFLYCGSTSDSSGNGSPPHVDCTNDVENEISTYRAEEQIGRDKDTLEWWRQHEHRFKTLSKLAQNLLCIPYVPCEWLFS